MEYAPGTRSAALTGDYVGVESCIDLRNEEEFEAHARDCERSYERRRWRRGREAVAVGDGVVRGRREAVAVGDGVVRGRREAREFPPPITYLARTENQPSHMPWVMKRYYMPDGRLVIREEKVIHHEYFRAHRADGRLTLQLIQVDSNSSDDDVVNDNNVDGEESTLESSDNAVDDIQVLNENEKEKREEEEEEAAVEVVNEEEEAVARVMVSSVSMAALCITEGVRSGGMLTSASSSCLTPTGGGNKCYGFNSLRSSSASSLFHLQVPAIRPVIS